MINDYLRYELKHADFIKKSDILEKLKAFNLSEKNDNKQSSDALKDAYEIVELFLRTDFSFKDYLKDMDDYMTFLQNVNNCSSIEKNTISRQYNLFTEHTQLLCQIFLYLDHLKTQYQGFYKGNPYCFNLSHFQGDTLYFTDFEHLDFFKGNDYKNMYRSFIIHKSEVVGLMLYNPTKKCDLPENLYCFPNPSLKTFEHSSLNDTFFFEDFNKALDFARQNVKDLAECFEDYSQQHHFNFFDGYQYYKKSQNDK